MNKENVKIGVLGFGNMGQAIIEGWLKNDTVSSDQIFVSGNNQEKLKKNAEALNIQAISTNTELVESSDVVIFAVKPQMIHAMIEEVGEALNNKIIVSVAVSVYLKDFEEMLTTDTEVLCMLPNMPVSIGEGAVVFESDHSLSEESHALVKALFEEISVVTEVKAEQMDAAGIISGCGPAFMAMVIESFADGAVKYGLSREAAYQLASQTLVGTGKWQLDSGLSPGQLKDQVTSPAGTTIKGVTSLEENGLRNAFISTFDAILGE